MSPTIFSTAIQSTTLKVCANLVAQALSQRNEDGPLSIDVQRVALFGVFGLITSPINSWWQQYLENSFPTHRSSGSASKKSPSNLKEKKLNGSTSSSPPKKPAEKPVINWTNVFIKLLLDQTIGQVFMNSTFITITKWPQLGSVYRLYNYIWANIFTILRASWRLWPLVALINFIFVPVSWRVLVASIVGFGWNIFLCILASRM